MNAAELDLIIRATVDDGLRGLGAMDTKINQIKTSAAAMDTSLSKASQSINNVSASASRGNTALGQQVAALTGVSTAASKVSQTVVNEVGTIVNGFNSIEDSIDKIASGFSEKWDPIIKGAQDAAGAGKLAEDSFKSLATTVANFGGGVLKFNADTTAIKAAFADIRQFSLTAIPPIQLRISTDAQSALAGLEHLGIEIQELSQTGVTSINKLNAALNTLKTASANATDVGSIARYNVAIEKLSGEATRLKTVSTAIPGVFSNVAKGSNTASFAVQNFGRVLQDLPFGFIGIANNLNPLLESFQRLQSEAKKTGTSIISSLGASLAGGGGIGLALSAVTAAVSLATFGFSAWTRGLNNTKKETEDAKKATDEYAETLKKAANEVARELTQTELLVAGLDRGNLSYDEKKKVLEKLAEISPQYFGTLRIEKGLIEGLASSYKLYIDNLVASLKSKAAQGQIEILNNQLVGVSNKLDEINNRFANKQTFAGLAGADKINEILNRSLHTYDDILELSRLTGKSENEIRANLQQRNGLLVTQTRVLNQIDALTNQISSKDLKTAFNIDTKGAKDGIDEITKILEKLKIERQEVQIDIKISPVDKEIKDVELLAEAIEKLKLLKAPEAIIVKLQTQLDEETIPAILHKLQQRFDNFKLEIPPPPPVKIPTIIDFSQIDNDFFQLKGKVEALAAILKIDLPVNFGSLNAEELNKLLKAYEAIKKGAEVTQKSTQKTLQEISDDFKKLANDTVSNMIVAFGQGIGAAAAGSGFGEMFRGMFTAIGEGLKALGATLIGITPLITAIKTAKIFQNPAIAIPVGIGLEILGSLLEAKLGQITKFETGGIVTSPMLGLIGERGKEVVFPLERLHEFIKVPNEQGGYIASTRVSGQDLIVLIERAKRQNGRTY